MIVLNFSLALLDKQKRRIEELTGSSLSKVLPVPLRFAGIHVSDQSQISGALDLVPLDWKNDEYIINLPPEANPVVVALLLLEIVARSNRFPKVISLKWDVEDGHAVSSIVDLHSEEFRRLERIEITLRNVWFVLSRGDEALIKSLHDDNEGPLFKEIGDALTPTPKQRKLGLTEITHIAEDAGNYD